MNKRINLFLANRISRADFFKELQWHEETHQICFCSIASLQFINRVEANESIYDFSYMGEPIVEKLVSEYGLTEQMASDLFYSSETFRKFASSRNFLDNWLTVYKLLIDEIKSPPNPL